VVIVSFLVYYVDMMKVSLKTYGIFILFGIIVNIIIFCYFSKQLEEYVYYKTLEKYGVTNPEFMNFEP